MIAAYCTADTLHFATRSKKQCDESAPLCTTHWEVVENGRFDAKFIWHLEDHANRDDGILAILRNADPLPAFKKRLQRGRRKYKTHSRVSL